MERALENNYNLIYFLNFMLKYLQYNLGVFYE